MVRKIGCFFTGGYTESNAMQLFLMRINDQVVLKQFCPNRTRKRKRPNAETDLISDVSGLTGASLTSYIYQYITEHSEEFKAIDAIVIEDDLDGKYTRDIVTDGNTIRVSSRTEEFEKHSKEVAQTIRQKLGKSPTFPVIQFYAAPEIETWLLSDWEHSFGLVYGPRVTGVLTTQENQYFSHQYRQFVKNYVLMQYNDNIENYGYFDGQYRKLSDVLIQSMDSFKVSIAHERTELALTISGNHALYFSKRTHGDEMLRQVSPDEVYKHCSVYFREAYNALKSL